MGARKFATSKFWITLFQIMFSNFGMNKIVIDLLFINFCFYRQLADSSPINSWRECLWNEMDVFGIVLYRRQNNRHFWRVLDRKMEHFRTNFRVDVHLISYFHLVTLLLGHNLLVFMRINGRTLDAFKLISYFCF